MLSLKAIQQFVVGMVKRLSEGSPLGSSFLRATSFFHLDVLLHLLKQKLTDRFKIRR